MAINFGQIAGAMQKREDWYGQKRESLADKFAAWRQQNPYATQEQMQTYINQISGGNEYIAGGAPDSAGLAAIAKNNLAEKNIRDQGRRVDRYNTWLAWQAANPNATAEQMFDMSMKMSGGNPDTMLPGEDLIALQVKERDRLKGIEDWKANVDNFNTQQKLVESMKPRIENYMSGLPENVDWVKARQDFFKQNPDVAGLLKPQDGSPISEFSLDNILNQESYEDFLSQRADANIENVLNYLKTAGPDVADKVTTQELMRRFPGIGKVEASRALSGAKKKYNDYKTKVEREFTQEVSDEVMKALENEKITPQAALDFVKARYPEDDPLANSLMQDPKWTEGIIAEATRLRNIRLEEKQGTFLDQLRMEAERLAEKPFMKPEQIVETITQRAKLNKTMLASFGDDFNLTTFLQPIADEAKIAYDRNEALRKQELTRQWDTDVRNVIKEDLARFIRNNNLDAATRLIENKIKSTLLPEVQEGITQRMKDDLISEIQGNMQQEQISAATAKNQAAQTSIGNSTSTIKDANVEKAVGLFSSKETTGQNVYLSQAAEHLATKYVMDQPTIDIIQTLVADDAFKDIQTMQGAITAIEPYLKGYATPLTEYTAMVNEASLAKAGAMQPTTFTDYAEKEKSLFKGQRQRLSALLEEVSQITDPRVRLRKMEDLAVRWKKNASSYMTQLNAERRVAEGDGGWLLAGTGAYDNSLIESMNDDISFMDNVIKQQITQAKADVESGDYMGRPQLPTQVGDSKRNDPLFPPDESQTAAKNWWEKTKAGTSFVIDYDRARTTLGMGDGTIDKIWGKTMSYFLDPEKERKVRKVIDDYLDATGTQTFFARNPELWAKFKENPIQTMKTNSEIKAALKALDIELPE